MKENSPVSLIAEIDKTIQLAGQNILFYKAFNATDRITLGNNTSSAIVLAQIITDYYTCLETGFLRISRFFENSLSKEEWHKELLHKMTLDIPGIRPNVISDSTYNCLLEILKFRHFRRYYFQTDYDWDKLAMIEKKYLGVTQKIPEELTIFRNFLTELTKGI